MAEKATIILEALMNVSQVESSIGRIQKELKNLNIPKDIAANLTDSFSKLGPLLKDYKKQLNSGFSTQKDVNNFNTLGKKINEVFSEIDSDIKRINSEEIRLNFDLTAIKNTQAELTKYTNKLEEIISKTFDGISDNLAKKNNFNLDFLKGVHVSNEVKQAGKELSEAFNTRDIEKYRQAYEKLRQILNSTSMSSKTAKNIAQQMGLGDEAVQDVDKVKNKINELLKVLRISDSTSGDFERTRADLEATDKALEVLLQDAQSNGSQAFNGITSGIDNARGSMSQLTEETSAYGQSVATAASEVKSLQQSTQYFFSLRNMINLLKRGIKEAIETVKELDAAMTQTAVVTTFEVGDMWKKLPEYTQNANALGASVKDMYESATLYYQQGLQGAEVMNIASETMKMARIGGLEAADATDKMTAALRGFNMEINEASAQRVNDVYSNLAAKTASNTEELGTAMQRTASIAASAGMSFEGTAAFLAQAIETTREPAENLGTAMKTIVARFTELKKNPLEIVEVDGEEVDYNKVDTALQSIGVSLKDANGQFRALDQVFLDIAQRWDNLSQVQQRYVATTAAGSRQQSRFIAMMSNYERTLQLMDYANNSAGASNEQFGKTMESLEAKINKLKNAWNQFLMGIANNGAIKGIVDGLTGFLNITNKVIDKLSLGSGILKSALSIFAAFKGLKFVGQLANQLIGGIGGLVDPTSNFKAGFSGGAIKQGQTGATQAKAISDPIVVAVNRIYGVLTGKQATQSTQSNNTADFKAFQKANSDLRSFLGGVTAGKEFSLNGAYQKISGLDDRQQKAILQQLPGLQLSLQKNGIKFDSSGLSDNAKKLVNEFVGATNKSLKNNELTTQNALQLFGSPQDFKRGMATLGPEYAKAASEIIFNQDYYQEQYNKIWERLNTDDAYIGHMGSEEAIEAREAELRAQAEVEAKAATEAKGLEDLRARFSGTASAGMQTANAIAGVGQAATMAGQGVAQLGMQLSNAGFTQAGQAVTNLGYQISSLGMIASSVGSVVGKVTAIEGSGGTFFGGLKAAALAHPYIAAAGIAITAIGGIIAYQKLQEKKLKDAAEKATSDYKEVVEQTTEKISTLQSARDVFNELGRGVDKFGNNISLTDEEYAQFLETSSKVAEQAPELIRGYDAQGHAIIATGNAIDQLISKQEELQKTARDTYITNSSIDDILGGIRVSDAYKKINRTILGTDFGADFSKQTSAIAQTLSKAGIDNFDAISKQLFGKEIDLFSPSNEDIRLLSEHYSDIINLIESQNNELTDKQRESLKDIFASLGEDWNSMLTELQPLSEVIGQYLSAEGLDAAGLELGDEFTQSFNKGLESLTMTAALEGWDASKLKSEALDYAEGFKAMTQEGSEYATIMAKVTEEQEKYNNSIGETGAISNYKNAIEDYAVELENLADKYDDGTAAGEIFANGLREQANNIRNYAIDSIQSLGEALNSLSDEFASARKATERFEEATKEGDYYTAAEGYKSIIETVLDEKNVAGDGSLTGWAGAEELLGQNFVDNNSWDEIITQIKKVQGCFEDGADGVMAFNDYLVEAWENAGGAEGALAGLGTVVDGGFEFDLQNEDLAEYAKLLNISEDALAALIDKARQWVPITLGDPKKIRQAIEASEYSMTGTSTKGDSLLYTSESQFRREARQQGIVGENYTQAKSEAREEGVRFLTVENLTAKNQKDGGAYLNKVLSNIGLKGSDKTLDNAVAALTKMGFSLEEQQQILTADGIKLADGQATKEAITESFNEQAYALENPTVAGIADDTGVIASAATAMLASMGILTDEARQKIEQSTSTANLEGISQTLNPEGGFKNSTDRTNAVNKVQNQLDDLYATRRLLEQGGLTDTSEYENVVAAISSVEDALKNEQAQWDATLESAQSYVEGVGRSEQEKNFLSQNAINIQDAINSGDANAVVQLLEHLHTEGDLSTQTMIDLGNQLMRTGGASSQLNEYILGLSKDLKVLEEAANQPFYFKTELTGDDLEQHLAEYESLSDEEKTLLLRTDIDGEEKTENFINEINEMFGDGTQTTKSVILQATAEIANGNTEGAEQLLADAGFSEGNVQTITQKLSVICDGSVANPGDVKEAIQSELDNLVVDETIKFNIQTETDKINYITSVDEQAIENARANAKKGAEMPVTVDPTGSAAKTVSNLAKTEYKTVYVEAKKRGSWSFTLNVDKKARGQNYSIPAHQSLSFGSAAGGMNVPKPKKSHGSQMTALVGEEGFEVGYIPSEQRSVIFGANGPEMTSFPKDTIIYPHDKSKEILRRGKSSHINAGSYQGGLDTVKSKNLKTSVESYIDTSVAQSVVSTAKQTGNNLSKTAEDTAKAIARVTVWWENAARRAEAIQRKMDKNQKSYEKYLARIDATLRTTGTKGKGNAFIANSEKYIVEQQRQFNKAKKELQQIDKGKWTSGKNKGKKADATKSNFKKGAENVLQISYKKGKQETTEYVNTKGYIRKKNGAYQISQKKLNKIDNIEKRKAVKEELEKELNDRISKKNKAADEIAKTKEQLESFSEELYNTFFAWETSLTRIWNLTQQIESLTAKLDRTDTARGLLDAQIASGLRVSDKSSRAQELDTFQQKLQQQNDIVKKRAEAITNAQKEVKTALGKGDEQKQIRDITARLKADEKVKANIENKALEKERKELLKKKKNKKLTKAEKARLKEIKTQIKANDATIGSDKELADAQKLVGKKGLNDTQIAGFKEARKQLREQKAVIDRAQSFMTTTKYADGTVAIDFNYDKFNEEKAKGNISEDAAKAIEDYINGVIEANDNLNDLINNLGNDLTDYYKDLTDLNNQWADYEDQLIQITEESNKKELDAVKKLSDSIKQAMDELLKEVKRKLDERRQREDNAKTEQDISRKQQRLAALRADTSGGHQVEIAQLEKEIADAQQNYQRSLEDQLLDKLQQQADEAAQQRERQIQLQEEILTSTNNIAQVEMWMSMASDPNLTEEERAQLKEEIRQAYREANDYEKHGQAGQERIDTEFETFFNGLSTNREEVSNLTTAIESLEDTIKSFEELQKKATIEDLNDKLKTAKKSSDDITAKLTAAQKNKKAKDDALKTANSRVTQAQGLVNGAQERFNNAQTDLKRINNAIAALDTKIKNATNQRQREALIHQRTQLVGQRGQAESKVVAARASLSSYQNNLMEALKVRDNAQKEADSAETTVTKLTKDLQTITATIDGLKKQLADLKFASGGLNTQTGPAWLDGTPSKPELVLNPTDTKNFLMLKDVLASAMSGMGEVSNNYGGNATYEININVDKLTSDYDVDKVAERVKKIIVKDSSYRNVTQVRNLR